MKDPQLLSSHALPPSPSSVRIDGADARGWRNAHHRRPSKHDHVVLLERGSGMYPSSHSSLPSSQHILPRNDSKPTRNRRLLVSFLEFNTYRQTDSSGLTAGANHGNRSSDHSHFEDAVPIQREHHLNRQEVQGNRNEPAAVLILSQPSWLELATLSLPTPSA